MCSVGYSTGGGSVTLAVDECYGLSTNIEDQRVHQGHTIRTGYHAHSTPGEINDTRR